ncbi:MAG TPA: sigma-70 family RNA polymerase sigma factor [Candidatus Limnocylindria bacterium]|nr:sigma-70 family RNA polymerase sigma factor [Candidatus Limnocylindria bacterium]
MDDAGPALEHLLRTESGRVLGGLVRRFGDLDLAEDVFQEACLEALQRWPVDGVPGNPAAWLTTVARNRALDRVRRERLRLGKEADSLGLREGDADGRATWSASASDDEGPLADDELQLILLCCHPALAQDAQVALTLRAVCGLTTSEVAAAFLVPEPTLAQRVVRAKRKIALAGIPFRLPEGAELAERLAPALNVVYLVFNEGYAATSSDLPVRRELCAEAIRLARLLVDLAPGDPEALGLLALLLLQDSRRAARVDAAGRLVPLAEQDRFLWDACEIDEGAALVEQALATGRLGPYQLQAAVAALHARATDAEPVDWSEIHALYRIHEVVAPSPMVTLNRAVALARLEGPEAGLSLVDDLRASGALVGHHRLESVRAHLLEESGRVREAQVAFARAADLATSPAERDYLRARASRG